MDALDDRREKIASRRDEQGDPTHDRGDHPTPHRTTLPVGPRPTPLAPGALEQHIRDDEERESPCQNMYSHAVV